MIRVHTSLRFLKLSLYSSSTLRPKAIFATVFLPMKILRICENNQIVHSSMVPTVLTCSPSNPCELLSSSWSGYFQCQRDISGHVHPRPHEESRSAWPSGSFLWHWSWWGSLNNTNNELHTFRYTIAFTTYPTCYVWKMAWLSGRFGRFWSEMACSQLFT